MPVLLTLSFRKNEYDVSVNRYIRIISNSFSPREIHPCSPPTPVWPYSNLLFSFKNKSITKMAEKWLAMHASSGGTGRYAANNVNSSVNQSSGMRQSVTHDSAHESDDKSRRTPGGLRKSGSRLDGMPPIEASPGRSERALRSGNERLYEAYNDLHALAQDFEKPFDAPAILVVGHQTDGKSGTILG